MRKPSTEAMQLFLHCRPILEAAGAMPPLSPAKELGAAEMLVAFGVTKEEAASLIGVAITDKWHGPKLLDYGLGYLRRNLSQLRSMYDEAAPVAPPKRKFNKLDVSEEELSWQQSRSSNLPNTTST